MNFGWKINLIRSEGKTNSSNIYRSCWCFVFDINISPGKCYRWQCDYSLSSSSTNRAMIWMYCSLCDTSRPNIEALVFSMLFANAKIINLVDFNRILIEYCARHLWWCQPIGWTIAGQPKRNSLIFNSRSLSLSLCRLFINLNLIKLLWLWCRSITPSHIARIYSASVASRSTTQWARHMQRTRQ